MICLCLGFIFASNLPVFAAISPERPRVLLNPERLAELRQMACYDSHGSRLPGCTATAEWNTWISLVSDRLANGSYEDVFAWHLALLYQITGNPDYAQRALALVDAQIANGMDDERYNQFLYICYQMQDAACVYDWCYHLLTANQRNTWRNYMNQVLTELWNNNDNPYYTWAGWAVDDPGNNYHYSFLLATALIGVALYNDNPSPPTLPFGGTNYKDILAFLTAKLGPVTEWCNTWGQGGGWHEGDGYGKLSKRHMMDVFMVLRNAGIADYFYNLAFSREALYYQVYAYQPGYGYVYPGGDLPNYGFNSNQYDRNLLMQLAEGLAGTLDGEYAQFLVNRVFDGSHSMRSQYAMDFFLSHPLAPEKNIGLLALAYRARGLGWFNSRSSWDSNAVSVSFVSTGRVQSHQHQDQNSFLIYYKEWQAGDANIYTNSQIVGDPEVHNNIIVDGEQQRFGSGTGQLVRYQAGPDYTYGQGDASDAYYTGVGGWGGGVNRLLTTYLRDLVHLQPNSVVVFDRVSPVNQGTALTCLLNIAHQPVIHGTTVSAVNAGGALYQKTLLPANPDITSKHYTGDGGDSWQIRVKAPVSSAHYTFLNLIQVVDANVAAMTASAAVSDANAKMTGVHVQSSGRDWVVMFGTTFDGAPVSGSLAYTIVPSAGVVRHLLCNLPAHSGYAVHTTPGSSLAVTVTPGSGLLSSDQGVLSFTTANGILMDKQVLLPLLLTANKGKQIKGHPE